MIELSPSVLGADLMRLGEEVKRVKELGMDMCAITDHALSSAVGFKGIARKILIFLMVGMANILDVNVIGTGSVLRTAAIFFYLSNEGVSLLENAAHLGLPVPGAIKEVLEQLHERAEHGGDDNDE